MNSILFLIKGYISICVIYVCMCIYTHIKFSLGYELLKKKILAILLLFFFREKGIEEERREEKHRSVVSHTPQLGTWPLTQAFALTGD